MKFGWVIFPLFLLVGCFKNSENSDIIGVIENNTKEVICLRFYDLGPLIPSGAVVKVEDKDVAPKRNNFHSEPTRKVLQSYLFLYPGQKSHVAYDIQSYYRVRREELPQLHGKIAVPYISCSALSKRAHVMPVTIGIQQAYFEGLEEAQVKDRYRELYPEWFESGGVFVINLAPQDYP